MNVALASKAPVLDIDPFSDEFLNDPYPFHAAMRDAGPVVRLARYNIWALARYANVHPALADWEVWSSAAGRDWVFNIMAPLDTPATETAT